MSKGNFREAVRQLILDLGYMQYNPNYGDIARKLLADWDKVIGDDWVNETLNEFKDKQNNPA